MIYLYDPDSFLCLHNTQSSGFRSNEPLLSNFSFQFSNLFESTQPNLDLYSCLRVRNNIFTCLFLFISTQDHMYVYKELKRGLTQIFITCVDLTI